MEASVMDPNTGELLSFVDVFKSFIWTERYNECGDFELYVPASSPAMPFLAIGNRIQIESSDREMIIEEIMIESDEENIPYATITGRSLESILDRRIIWGSMTFSGKLQEAIRKILDENIISPKDPKRKIPGFVFENSDNDYIRSLTIDCQFKCDNVYSVISKLCKENGIGFKILPDGIGGFVFSLYNGEDRSYYQDKNPYVVFSPEFDNLISSSYLDSTCDTQNVSLVRGSKLDDSDMYLEVTLHEDSPEGLYRREMCSDGGSVSRTVYTDSGTVEVTEEEYILGLKQVGVNDLIDHFRMEVFDSEIDGTRQFICRKDYNIGDIVQVVNEFGYESKSRVVEYIFSHDENGVSEYPTFATINM